MDRITECSIVKSVEMFYGEKHPEYPAEEILFYVVSYTIDDGEENLLEIEVTVKPYELGKGDTMEQVKLKANEKAKEFKKLLKEHRRRDKKLPYKPSDLMVVTKSFQLNGGVEL